MILDTPSMTREEAKADLEAKVHELLNDIVELGMRKLDTLQASGAGIVGDHAENGQCWITPKNFICAFADDIKWNYAKPNPDRAWNHLIKNYYRMM